MPGGGEGRYVQTGFSYIGEIFSSWGMSGDFEDAIRNGATMVRVGTAIFGARYYPT